MASHLPLHPKARPETPTQPPSHSGIDYLALLDEQHGRATAGKVNYAARLGNPSRHPPTTNHDAPPPDQPTDEVANQREEDL